MPVEVGIISENIMYRTTVICFHEKQAYLYQHKIKRHFIDNCIIPYSRFEGPPAEVGVISENIMYRTTVICFHEKKA